MAGAEVVVMYPQPKEPEAFEKRGTKGSQSQAWWSQLVTAYSTDLGLAVRFEASRISKPTMLPSLS